MNREACWWWGRAIFTVSFAQKCSFCWASGTAYGLFAISVLVKVSSILHISLEAARASAAMTGPLSGGRVSIILHISLVPLLVWFWYGLSAEFLLLQISRDQLRRENQAKLDWRIHAFYIQQECVHARNPWRDLYLNSYANFIKLIKLHSRFSSLFNNCYLMIQWKSSWRKDGHDKQKNVLGSRTGLLFDWAWTAAIFQCLVWYILRIVIVKSIMKKTVLGFLSVQEQRCTRMCKLTIDTKAVTETACGI